MRHRYLFWLFCFFIVALAGCDSQLDSSRGNIEEALKKVVEDKVACFKLPAALPYTENAATAWQQFAPFESINFVEKEDVIQISDKGPYRHQSGRKFKAMHFELTALGSKYYREMERSFGQARAYGFCYAKGALKDVYRIGEVQVNHTGRQALEALYTYELLPEQWFLDLQEKIQGASIETPWPYQEQAIEIGTTLKSSEQLYLTKEGWKAKRDISAEDDFILEGSGQTKNGFFSRLFGGASNGTGAWLQKLVLGL